MSIHRCRVCNQVWEVPPYEESSTTIIYCEAKACAGIRKDIEALPDGQADEMTIKRIIQAHGAGEA